jgi:DNA-binding CsgD family transcriptional regulator
MSNQHVSPPPPDQSHHRLQNQPNPNHHRPATGKRIGDVSAMLRVMKPLHRNGPDPVSERRRLVADLCRFIGVNIGTVDPQSSRMHPSGGNGQGMQNADQPIPGFTSGDELSPRLEQTLRHLLNGDSEKQVARKLDLSQHTVHVYVKALYRRFGVSTRAELLSRYLKR